MDLMIAISNKADGNMAVKWGEEKEVKRNRAEFLQKLGLLEKETVGMSLSGKTKILLADKRHKGKLRESDGVITREKNLGVWMVTGDCFPVILYEPQQQILAMAHCGYSGIMGGIIEKMLKKLKAMQVQPEKLQVYIGPGIRKESYMWEEKVVIQKDMPDWKPFLIYENGQVQIDLWGYLQEQLVLEGVKREMIAASEVDTGKDAKFFSHYRAKRNGEAEGRFMTLAMMRE